jgi:hypothetical protein
MRSDISCLTREDIEKCDCKRSDAWRCAVEKNLNTVSCHCKCHNKRAKQFVARWEGEHDSRI